MLNDKFENDTNYLNNIQNNETNCSNLLNTRQARTVPTTATLKLKVIFNQHFKYETGTCTFYDCSTVAGARLKAKEIVDKVNSYYTTEFSSTNRLGSSISIVLDGGKEKMFL